MTATEIPAEELEGLRSAFVAYSVGVTSDFGQARLLVDDVVENSPGSEAIELTNQLLTKLDAWTNWRIEKLWSEVRLGDFSPDRLASEFEEALNSDSGETELAMYATTAMVRAVAELANDAYRAVLIWKFFGGLSLQSIARLLHCTKKQAKNICREAVEALGETLDGYGI